MNNLKDSIVISLLAEIVCEKCNAYSDVYLEGDTELEQEASNFFENEGWVKTENEVYCPECIKKRRMYD